MIFKVSPNRSFASDVVASEETPLSKKTHVEMFVVSFCISLAACLLTINTTGEVCFRLYKAWVVPGLCMSYELFGFECPACGLTRSFISFARMDFAKAFAFHRVGPVFAILVLLQLPYRLWCIKHWPHRSLPRRVTRSIGYCLLFALITNWLLGQLGI